MKNEISVDTYDFIIITCLVGGFYTNNWWPAIIFTGLYSWYVWANSKEEK